MTSLCAAALAGRRARCIFRDPAPSRRTPILFALVAALAVHGGPVYRGRDGNVVVRVPRAEATARIDGTLSAPQWQQAAVLAGFSQYQPVDGAPAEDSTEVLVWYSPTAIYFGIRAYEAHGAPHATLANRDKIDGDDNVQIILTPFLHGRQALVFAVNPFGVQEDGTITEGTSTTGIGISSKSTGTPIGQLCTTQTSACTADASPDFVYESKGQVTSWGYEVEVRIPFRSLKYQAKDPQDWGINIVRVVQHSGHQDSWYPAKLAAASFLQQSGTLAELSGLESGRALDLNPFTTEKTLGAPAAARGAGWQYAAERPQIGANVRWGLTNNLLLSGTVRPDFAEVESDATKLVIDPRNAVSYPEKRPFFLDGLEQFSTPNNLVYTRRIEAPDAAAKLTGKLGGLSMAYLGAQDDEPLAGGVGGSTHPLFDILRLREDFAKGSQVGAVLTDREDGGAYNRVAGVDARVTWSGIYALMLQGATSSTGAPAGAAGTAGAGPLWQAHFTRGGRSFLMDYNVTGIDPEFMAGSGFISRRGVVNGTLDHRYTWYPASALVETVGLDVSYSDTWVYRSFTSWRAPEDRRNHLTLLSTLHGGWQLQAAIYLETYGYDPSLYANYYLARIGPRDTTFTRFVGVRAIPNTDYVFSITTPTFSKLDLTLLEIAGRDENFFEWSPADISITEATLNLRPTDKLRAQLTYNAQLYFRHTTGVAVGRTFIPRLALEYQLSRPIFLRLVGQYDAAYQNTLIDDSRTGLPIYYGGSPAGPFVPASQAIQNQAQMQALFAYQPVPGTVAFIGYGNALEEPTAFRFVGLRRTADNFFVKFSYLFQLQ